MDQFRSHEWRSRGARNKPPCVILAPVTYLRGAKAPKWSCDPLTARPSPPHRASALLCPWRLQGQSNKWTNE
eukprot:6182149-Pleurochrysis_carterae.AAC.1